jgi:Na+-driven multidrug efflux pump
VVLIPVAFLLAMSGKAEIVWWAFPIAEVMSVIASLVFFIRIYKRTVSKIPE